MLTDGSTSGKETEKTVDAAKMEEEEETSSTEPGSESEASESSDEQESDDNKEDTGGNDDESDSDSDISCSGSESSDVSTQAPPGILKKPTEKSIEEKSDEESSGEGESSDMNENESEEDGNDETSESEDAEKKPKEKKSDKRKRQAKETEKETSKNSKKRTIADREEPTKKDEKQKGKKDKKDKKDRKHEKDTSPSALADAEKPIAKKAKVDSGKKNSTKFRKEWQAFKRYLKNPSRCPAKIAAACKNEDWGSRSSPYKSLYPQPNNMPRLPWGSQDFKIQFKIKELLDSRFNIAPLKFSVIPRKETLMKYLWYLAHLITGVPNEDL